MYFGVTKSLLLPVNGFALNEVIKNNIDHSLPDKTGSTAQNKAVYYGRPYHI